MRLFEPTRAPIIQQRIRPRIAAKTIGQEAVHQRVRRLSRTVGYRLSQRARKIEELLGEAKFVNTLLAVWADCMGRETERRTFRNMHDEGE